MLAHERTGSGEPLVLIHGVGHRRQAWGPVVDLLAMHHEVITIDLPGHGESPGRFERGDLVADVIHDRLAHTFEALDLERPHVAGNSLGGMIALELGVQDRVSSVTALSPAGFWVGRADFAYIEALFGSILGLSTIARPVMPHLVRNRHARTALFSWLSAHPSRIHPDAAVGDFHNLMANAGNLRAILEHGRGRPMPEQPVVPTTVAWATRDVVLLPYQALRARRAMPGVDHKWLPGCGHVPMSDDPHLVATTILERTGALGQGRRLRRVGATSA